MVPRMQIEDHTMSEDKTLETKRLPIKPETFEVTEQYEYQVVVDADPHEELVSDPISTITIVVPYDGYQCFPPEAIELAAARLSSSTSPISAPLGCLSITHLPLYEDTFVPEAPSLTLLDVPLRNLPLDESNLGTDRFECRFNQSVPLDVPDMSPLEVTVEVVEDEIIRAIGSREFFDQIKRPKQYSAAFSTTLTLALTVRAWVPKMLVEDVKPPVQAAIQRLSFKWPNVVSAWQLHVLQLCPDLAESKIEAVSWYYDPETKSIECAKIALARPNVAENKESQRIPYTATLYLQWVYAGEFMLKDSLVGRVDIRLDGVLLSGQTVNLYDATTCEPMIADQTPVLMPPVRMTRLIGQLTIKLSECFRDRKTVTCRRLYFEGVKPNALRYADLNAVLKEKGYEIRDQGFLQSEDSSSQWMVAARRRDANEHVEIYLWLAVQEDTPAETRRDQKYTDGDISISTVFPGSNLILDVYGYQRGGSGVLNHDINQIHSLLKERFRSVAMLR